MDDFLFRQISLLGELVNDYRKNAISLNSLILKIESICDVIDSTELKESLSSVVLEMEQINAFALSSQSELTANDKADVDRLLIKIEEIIGEKRVS